MKSYIDIRRMIQILAFMPFTLAFFAKLELFSTAILITTAVAGAFYCGYLCPFGFVQEMASALGKKLKIKKKTLPHGFHFYFQFLRYLLYVLVSAVSIDFIVNLLKYDPRSNLHLILTGKSFTLVMGLSIMSFFLLAMFVDKPFCRYLCIKGALYGLLSKFRMVSIVRNTDSCVNCKRCDKVCQVNISISTSDYVHQGTCINCFQCIKACPVKNTLAFRILPFKKMIVKSVALCACLLAVFFGGQFFENTSAEQVDTVTAHSESTSLQPDSALYYKGTGEGYNGPILVEVGIDEGRIVSVEVLDQQDDYDWYSKAKGPVIERILENQSPDVDVVSGATYSSLGIIEAVKDALSKVDS